MSGFNIYQAYSYLGSAGAKVEEDPVPPEVRRMEAEQNAFLTFHLVENKPQMEKFVRELCEGRRYNQKFEWDGETLEVEFMESSIKVSLTSPVEGRSGYFQYPV